MKNMFSFEYHNNVFFANVSFAPVYTETRKGDLTKMRPTRMQPTQNATKDVWRHTFLKSESFLGLKQQYDSAL